MGKNGFLVNVLLYISDIKMLHFTSSSQAIAVVTVYLFNVHTLRAEAYEQHPNGKFLMHVTSCVEYNRVPV